MPVESQSHRKPEAAEDPASPEPAGGPLAGGELDEFAKGWYDSSFDLKRGLWVIETDLDPAVTHGIVVRKRQHHGGGSA